MCGVIHIKRVDGIDARSHVLARYESQKDRGQQGYGFVALNKGVVVAYERSETEEEIKAKLEAVSADEIFFHHRFPTSTPNFAEAAHPIKVSNDKLKYDYYVIHNGIIMDDEEYKPKHEAEGFKYTTEMTGGWYVGGVVKGATTKWNDSEALAIELALDLEDKCNGVNLTGSIAFIVLQVDKTTQKAIKLYWGRNNGSPLIFHGLENHFMSISSEGYGDTCKPHMLFSFDYATGRGDEKAYQVGWHGRDDYKYEDEDGYPVVAQPYTDMGDEYYILIENAEELKDEIASMKLRNEEVDDLEAELKICEDRILNLEAEYDEEQFAHYA